MYFLSKKHSNIVLFVAKPKNGFRWVESRHHILSWTVVSRGRSGSGSSGGQEDGSPPYVGHHHYFAYFTYFYSLHILHILQDGCPPYIGHLSTAHHRPVQPLQPSTAQYSLIQPSTARCSPGQSSTAQYSPVPPSTAQYHPV